MRDNMTGSCTAESFFGPCKGLCKSRANRKSRENAQRREVAARDLPGLFTDVGMD
jgi:hypothetical protein